MRFCSASGVRSTITVSSESCSTQSGTVSRTTMPVMAWTVGAMLSMCWMLTVESTSILASQNLQHIFVALAVLAAGNIRVGKLVHQRPRADCARGWRPRSISSKIVSLVIDLLARDRFELRHELGDALSAVRFHDADHDVFAAAMPPDRLAQHAVRLADARRVAEKQLQRRLWSFRAAWMTASHSSGVFGMRAILFYGALGKLGR